MSSGKCPFRSDCDLEVRFEVVIVVETATMAHFASMSQIDVSGIRIALPKRPQLGTMNAPGISPELTIERMRSTPQLHRFAKAPTLSVFCRGFSVLLMLTPRTHRYFEVSATGLISATD